MGIRSLFAGVSGLTNFQQQLDIIGNNIANSQTAGFKSSRVTFQDLLSQTSRGAVAPSTDVGGINPVQFGLGSSVAAVDQNFNQGTLLTTGRQLDLAISGNGFFKVNDGTTDYYTRNGAFDIDSSGYLVSTNTGFIAQGFNATLGVLDETTVADIQIPVGVVLPAEATTTVDVVGNLDSSSEQVGSIFQTDILYATELTGDDTDMEGLLAYRTATSSGNLISGLQSGITTVAFNDGTTDYTYTYVSSAPGANQFSSAEDLAALMNGTAATVTYNANGELAVGGAATVTVSSTNSSLNAALSNMGAPGTVSDQFAHTIETDGSDLLTNLRNSDGDPLNLAATDNITVSGDIGSNSMTSVSPLTVAAGDDVNDLMQKIQADLGLLGVQVVTGGKIEIEGLGGSNYAITNLDVVSDNASGGTAPTAFNNVFGSGNYSRTQVARDNWTTSFIAHDENGAAHTTTVKFNIRQPVGGNAVWVFDVESTEVSSGQADTVTSSNGTNSGTIQFSSDGSISFVSPTTFSVTPVGIAGPMSIDFDFGTAGGFEGLVQFESASSARFTEVTGFAAGELQNISINNEGIITGNFTNGQNMVLAQLTLSLFDNPAALEKVGSNNYVPSLNSGVPNDGQAQSGGRGELIPSALEGSNVDLAEEFVTLITAQRGFQTNARIITTANDILGELVNLVR